MAEGREQFLDPSQRRWIEQVMKLMPEALSGRDDLQQLDTPDGLDGIRRGIVDGMVMQIFRKKLAHTWNEAEVMDLLEQYFPEIPSVRNADDAQDRRQTFELTDSGIGRPFFERPMHDALKGGGRDELVHDPTREDGFNRVNKLGRVLRPDEGG